MNNEFGQHTTEWYRARLGMITGSRVGVLTGRRKGTDEFNDTALAYVYEVAAQRYMNERIVNDDTLFEDYLAQVNFETAAMRWGTEQEANARKLYAKIKGVDVVERGSVEHPDILFFASSPDGYIEKDREGKSGCLEIKCPKQGTYMKYRAEVKDGATLRKANKEYFYQCQSHIMCTGADWCDFVAYCPYESKPIHIVRIMPDGDAFKEIEADVAKANAIISGLRE